MGFIETLGQQIGGSAVGAGMGLLLQGVNDRRQLKQQQKLQDMQITGQQQMTDYNMKKQFEMWKSTNYGAQMEELKKANLNPALIYGMGGGGGMTAGSASGNVTAGTAPTGGREVQDMMGMGLQLQLLKAQKENIEADTKNKLGDAANKPIIGKNIETSTASLAQGIENQKAAEELTKIQTNIAKIDEWIKDRSKEEATEIIMWQAEKILNEVDNLARENIVDKATMYDRIKLIKTELATKALTNELIKATTKTEKLKPELLKAQTKTEEGKPAIQDQEIKLMQQQVESLVRQGIQKWEELRIGAQNANTNTDRQKQEEWVNDVSASTRLPMDIIEKIAQGIIFKNIISPDKTHTPIKGFR